MLFDNAIKSFMEAFNVLSWLLPRLIELARLIVNPFVAAFTVGILILVTGWRHVAGTLREKWLDRGWELERITTHNVKFFTVIYGLGAHATVFVGFLMVHFIIDVSLWEAWRLIKFLSEAK